MHVPKDDRSSSCQGHLGLWRVRASVPVQCPHLRQTAQARPPGTESEGRWGSWVLARGLQRQLRAVKVRRSTEPARGERERGAGSVRARRRRRHGAGRAAPPDSCLSPAHKAALGVPLRLLVGAGLPRTGLGRSLGVVRGTLAGGSTLQERAGTPAAKERPFQLTFWDLE